MVGGPKAVNRKIGPGQVHSFKYRLKTDAFSYWVFKSNLPLYATVNLPENSHVWYRQMARCMGLTSGVRTGIRTRKSRKPTF